MHIITHTSPPNIITHRLTHTKPDTQRHIRNRVESSNTRRCAHRKYVHRKCTIIQTGASCGIPEFSKCLSAHKRGAKTTSGHMILEKEFAEKIQTLPNVCLHSLPGVQNPLSQLDTKRVASNRIHSLLLKCTAGLFLNMGP